MYLNTNSAFEIVQGVLDLVMTKIGAIFQKDYKLQESADPLYFSKRGADVILRGKTIGSIGVIHPEVLNNFHIKYPVTCLEICLEDVFEHFKTSQD